jgi:hypothetical protein
MGGMLSALTLVSWLAHESHQLLLLVDLRHDMSVWERAMEWVGMSVVDVAVAVDVVVVLDMAMVCVPQHVRMVGRPVVNWVIHIHIHIHIPPQSHHPQHHHVS